MGKKKQTLIDKAELYARVEQIVRTHYYMPKGISLYTEKVEPYCPEFERRAFFEYTLTVQLTMLHVCRFRQGIDLKQSHFLRTTVPIFHDEIDRMSYQISIHTHPAMSQAEQIQVEEEHLKPCITNLYGLVVGLYGTYEELLAMTS